MVLKKFNTYSNDIIFVDGLWGTGKSLLAPIISGMERVEKVKIEHIYEYVCIMRYLDKISPDAAEWMFKTYSDLSQYNNLISREVNLRWNDDSGLANNPYRFQYIKRLFGAEGDSVSSYINDNNIALNIMSHMLMLVAEPIFEAYGDRVKLIEVVRHPLYMVKHWYAYLDRFDSSREFTISFDYKGMKIPWFASGWEDQFFEANVMDKVLISICRLYDWLDEATNKATKNGNKVFTVSFESLAMTPDEPMQQLENILGRRHYPKLATILRRQKIPRKTISQGKGHAAYGWSKKDSDKNEQDIYKQLLDYVKSSGSSDNIGMFQKLIERYNDRFPSILAKYQ